jgi:hypothetical protein
MPYRFLQHNDPVAASGRGGCFSGFLIPPLAVICAGILLAFSLSNVEPAFTASAISAPDVVEDSLSVMGDKPVEPANKPFQDSTISPIFRPEVQYWGKAITIWARDNGLDPNLVATVMQIESCGDPRALSRAGAMGLFQVMPYHFATTDNPYNPDTNALRGLAYLSRSLAAANGDARLALAGYNGGIGVINRPENMWSSQTQRYASWGSGIYTDAVSGGVESTSLNEWYTTHGISLCKQANLRLGLN